MRINLLGINYQSAPINIRERAAISTERLPDVLDALHKYVPHGVVLSTCNRTEIYASGSDSTDLMKSCESFIKDYLHVSIESMAPFVYKATDENLVKHLFRVACGLDSMIIGEYEVLGQVKQSFDVAEEMGMANLALRHVFHSAIRTGRMAREETGISKYALSVSSVAVNKALDVNPNIDNSKLVIIGAGEAARQAIRVAKSRGITRIVIVSRTEGRAVSLTSQCGGRPAGTDQLGKEICDADIVIACAASPHAVLHQKHVADAMNRRPGLPMIIIDIAMPRNVEPSVNEIANVHLFNMDDLTELADKNRSQREKETAAVENIILQETEILMKWWRVYSVRPAVKALMSKAEKIRAGQYKKSMKKLSSLSDEEKKSIDLLTMSIVDKILRDPILYLKSSEENGDGIERAEIIKELFKLDDIKDNE